MRIAYLIDKDAIGGGGEFIRVKMALRPSDEGRVFYSSRGECRASRINAWRPDEIWVAHLRALLHLLWNPFARVWAPIVFAVLGLHIRKYDYLPPTAGNRLKRLMRLMLERYLYRRCARIVVQNESDAIEVRRLYGDSTPVVIDTPSLGEWAPPDRISQKQFRKCFSYVYIGRFEFQKGQDRWLKVIAEKRESFRKNKLQTLFIGNGKELERCRRFVSAEGLGDLVRFISETPAIEPYLLQAQTVVSASRWEGYPFLLRKARAMGCRILATDCPGNRDVLAGYDKWEKLAL